MLRGDPTRDGLTRGGLLATVCLMALTSWGLGFGDALDGVLEVRSAYVNLDKGVFLLHARVEYPMGPAIRNALRDGLTLTFDLEARVDRDRRFWFNVNIVDLTLRRELSYHAVSDRYMVRDTHSGDQESFATLDEALQYLARWMPGRSWWNRSSMAATTPSACAPACAVATCRHRCAPFSSGATTGHG